MNFQDEFAEKAKEHLKPDPDEKIVKEWSAEIGGYFLRLQSKIGDVKDRTFVCTASPVQAIIEMDNVGLRLTLRKQSIPFTIAVTKIKDRLASDYDTLFLKDGELYSEKLDKPFSIPILEQYLKDTFDFLDL